MKRPDSSESPAAEQGAGPQKRSRSRTGCRCCKKSKVKCDEARPVCGNCLRSGKSCDYSLKLTWGGRPYKVPRVEKLNPIASLSRSQLAAGAGGSGVAPAAAKAVKASCSPAPENTLQLPQPPRSSRQAEPAALKPPSLNPSENLSFLLKMSDPTLNIPGLLRKEPVSRTLRPPLQAAKPAPPAAAFQSLEESYTDTPVKKGPSPSTSEPSESEKVSSDIQIKKEPSSSTLEPSPLASEKVSGNIQIKKEPSPFSREPSPFASEKVSSNIQNLNTKLGSLFDEKLTQLSPWSFLEEIDKSVSCSFPDLPPELQYAGDPRVTESENAFSLNSQLLLNSEVNLMSNDFSSASDLMENLTNNFTKTQELPEQPLHTFFSVPMISGFRTPPRNHYDEETGLLAISPSPASTSSSISEIMEPIPRGLLPLPDMLLNAPYFYDSFLFFTNLTSSILTPADSSVYINNPFKKVLPKLAMTNNGLMSLIVAFGSAHKSLLLKKDSTKIVDSLLGRALSDLLVLLNNKETCTSDLTLTLVMFFSSFLAFNYKSDKWKVHMNGAKQIFLMRGYNRPFDKILSDYKTDGSLISGEIKKSKLLYFLIRWFAYLDIFTNLSSPLEPTEDEIKKYCANSPSYLDSLSPMSDSFSSPNSFSSSFSIMDANNNGRAPSNDIPQNNDDLDASNTDPDNQIDYEVAETEDGLMKDESHQDIDYMLGFNIKFLPIFSQLAKLIKRVNLIKRSNERMNIASKASSIGLSPSIIESAINIQTKFQKLKYTVYETTETKRAKSLNAVVASNHCFLLMGMIQLYRRVLLMPRNSKIIQEMCLGILDAMTKHIDTQQPNSLGLILPLFIAGCECQNVNLQPLFIEKLHDFQEKGSVSAESGIEIMAKCWRTGRDWNEIMMEYDRNVVFL